MVVDQHRCLDRQIMNYMAVLTVVGGTEMKMVADYLKMRTCLEDLGG